MIFNKKYLNSNYLVYYYYHVGNLVIQLWFLVSDGIQLSRLD